MIFIKPDVLDRLKAAGYSTYRLKSENLLSGSVLSKLTVGGAITTTTIDTLCKLLKCQPGDIIAYHEDEE